MWKKIILFVFPFFAAFLIFAAFLYYQRILGEKGLLQVTANPQSRIYLDDKELGNTPMCRCKPEEYIKTGEYTLRIVPLDNKFQEVKHKITIQKSVLTVVDRTFLENNGSEGSYITLSPLSQANTSEITVSSEPDKADLWLDNALIGKTPFVLDNVEIKEHELAYSRSGYIRKSILVLPTKGYKLSAMVFLAKDPKATSEAVLKPHQSTVSNSSEKKTQVLILETPTGFLRVREASSTASLEIGQATPGNRYELLEESSEWLRIKLSDELTGWVSKQFAQKEE